MDKETREALEESISDWERKAKGEYLDKICPLCELGEKRDGKSFLDNKCIHCIIKVRTGKVQCHDTPYWDWDREEKSTSTKLRYADREVIFLKSFLPKEEKKVGIEVGDVVDIDDYSYSLKLEDGELKSYFFRSVSASDNYIVIATNLKLLAKEGITTSINREQTNDTLLQESTGKYYVFIQKRFLRLVEKKKKGDTKMKFIIKDSTVKKGMEVELYLKDDGDGIIRVYGKDNRGQQRILVSFKDGKSYRHTGADGMEGIVTEGRSRIAERNSVFGE